MGLRPGLVRDLIDHAIQLQVELDQLFVQVGDVVFVAVSCLDVELTLLVLARMTGNNDGLSQVEEAA